MSSPGHGTPSTRLSTTHLGEQPLPYPSGIQTGQVGDLGQQSDGVGPQRPSAVQQVLQYVVVRVADIRLGIDEQPWAALAGQHIAGMKVGEQQHLSRSGARQLTEERQTLAGQPAV